MIPIQRTAIRLKADPRRVLLKHLDFGNPARVEPIARYVLGLEEEAAEAQLQAIRDEFAGRHFDLEAAFRASLRQLGEQAPAGLSPTKQLLLGAYFTHEYSIQAAALFNPSIVPHPDQSGLGAGELRFILSLRAVGEGHISSIVFQTGVIGADGEIALDPVSPQLASGQHRAIPGLGEAGYSLSFPAETPLSSRVIFPHAPAESNGIEDARFVAFKHGDRSVYLSTYTAYNGRAIHPWLIETVDFRTFHLRALQGAAASDKGMALFPEKIGGRYAMIGRQGGRSLSIMYSDDLYRWENHQPLQHPQRSWELLQMGNCGSPVKTPQGWLLLTHAVGPLRQYVLSLSLLDLEQPEKVLASLEEPLLRPNAEEREGYVPNVLYTCGMIEHAGKLIIPYAMSDSAISFAVVGVEAAVGALSVG
jgi:predicted GH43/DUF377 family glycosyl hydrolase